MKLINFFKHLHTVDKHRFLVMKHCFRCGYYRRGLLHDLSKYSPTEFLNSVKYYQGYRSPTTAEREGKGYSEAWMHHKGRNRHHYEYWFDYVPSQHAYLPFPMPRQYLIESFCDRIAASKVYMGKKYDDSKPLEYFLTKDKYANMHQKTRNQLNYLLTYLKDHGEKETFKLIKKNRKNPDFLERI